MINFQTYQTVIFILGMDFAVLFIVAVVRYFRRKL